MTQAQIDAVTLAQQKFFHAAGANTAAQSAAGQAAQAAAAAQTNATVTVPNQCKKLQQEANDAFFAVQASQQTIIQNAQQAMADLSQAQLDLQAAITASLQTGAVEQV